MASAQEADRSGPDDYRGSSTPPSPIAVYFRELVVDFIATLIPGLWFVAATIPAVIFPLFWFITLIDVDSSADSVSHLSSLSMLDAVNKLSNTTSAFHWELFISALSVSFLLGQLFTRQDLEIPDKFSWIMGNIKNLNYCKLCLRFRWFVRTLGRDITFVIAHPRGWLVQAGRGIGFAWRVRRMASMARIERRRAVSTTERMSA